MADRDTSCLDGTDRSRRGGDCVHSYHLHAQSTCVSLDLPSTRPLTDQSFSFVENTSSRMQPGRGLLVLHTLDARADIDLVRAWLH